MSASFLIRRTVRRAVCLPVLSATLLMGTVPFAWAQVPPPAVLARSWVLLDVTSNQILASENAQERVEPASLTKLISAYVVFQALKDKKIAMEQTVIPSNIVRQVKRDESRMFIEANKPVTVDALVHGLIVQSGNDAALALAELVGGSEANFVAMMNDTAKRLGMAHTHFADTNGLPHQDHYTTAADLAVLSMHLIKDFPEYYSIFAVKEYTYNRIRQSNRNRLLWIDPSVDGLKTGHTETAGFCLAASAKRPLANMPNQNRRLVSVIMGERKESDRIQDSLKMLNYGFQAYDGVPLYKAGQVLNTLRIYKGKLNQLKVGIAADVMVSVPRGSSDKIKTTLSMSTPLIAPIAKGQALGTVQVQVDGKPITTLPVVALEAVPESNIVGRAWDSLLLKIQKIWDKRK